MHACLHRDKVKVGGHSRQVWMSKSNCGCFCIAVRDKHDFYNFRVMVRYEEEKGCALVLLAIEQFRAQSFKLSTFIQVCTYVCTKAYSYGKANQ